MNILGIDTTKKQAYVFGVFEDKKIVDVLSPYEKHSENLLEHVEGVLNFGNLAIKDIDVFANISGPGSFTGIRIGLTTVKALNFPFGKKVINMNVFDAFESTIQNGILLLECTQNSVYYGKFAKKKLVEYGVWEYANLPENLNDFDLYSLKEEHLNLPSSYKINVINNYSEIVLQQISLKAEKEEFSDKLLPFYIALSQAEKNLLEKEAKND